MDLPINFSTGALKPRYLFKSKAGPYPQKAQLKVQSSRDFGAFWSGLRNQWIYRQQIPAEQELCGLSARGTPRSSPAVRQEAPMQGALRLWRSRGRTPPRPRTGSLAHPVAVSTDRKPPSLAIGK